MPFHSLSCSISPYKTMASTSPTTSSWNQQHSRRAEKIDFSPFPKCSQSCTDSRSIQCGGYQSTMEYNYCLCRGSGQSIIDAAKCAAASCNRVEFRSAMQAYKDYCERSGNELVVALDQLIGISVDVRLAHPFQTTSINIRTNHCSRRTPQSLHRPTLQSPRL
jgi:hypothetical protein